MHKYMFSPPCGYHIPVRGGAPLEFMAGILYIYTVYIYILCIHVYIYIYLYTIRLHCLHLVRVK